MSCRGKLPRRGSCRVAIAVSEYNGSRPRYGLRSLRPPDRSTTCAADGGFPAAHFLERCFANVVGGHARARFRTGDDCAATRRTEAVADPRLLARAVTAITPAACAKIGLHRIFTDGEINV